MERRAELPSECGAKTIRKEEGQSTPARLWRREPPATHAQITCMRVARTSQASRSARARVARRGVGAKIRRDTRHEDDDRR